MATLGYGIAIIFVLWMLKVQWEKEEVWLRFFHFKKKDNPILFWVGIGVHCGALVFLSLLFMGSFPGHRG